MSIAVETNFAFRHDDRDDYNSILMIRKFIKYQLQ